MTQIAKTIKAREDSARRRLGNAGYRLLKTPARSRDREFYGVGYTVLDQNNMGVLGCGNRMYEASICEVEDFTDGIAILESRLSSGQKFGDATGADLAREGALIRNQVDQIEADCRLMVECAEIQGKRSLMEAIKHETPANVVRLRRAQFLIAADRMRA